MPLSASSRATLRLGVLALTAAAASSVWELLAVQSPGTPLYIATLPGPIATLRDLSLVIGLLLIAAGLLMPHAKGEREPTTLVALMYIGTALGLSAQLYAALRGMHGTQLFDLRPDALPLFVVKHGGLGLLIGSLIELGRRVLVSPKALTGPASQGPPAGPGENPPT